MKIYVYLLSAVICFLIPSKIFAEPSQADQLREYYNAVADGDYRSAIKSSASAALSASDTISVIADLFRLAEAVRYVELADYAKDEAMKAARNPLLSNGLHRMVSDAVITGLCTRSGDMVSADALKKKDSMPMRMVIAGPVEINGDDDLHLFSNAVMKKFPAGKSYTMLPDENGVFRFHSLCDEVRSRGFAAECRLLMDKEGYVLLGIGNSGVCDLYVDGIPVLRNQVQQRFFPVQQGVVLHLSAGLHRITVIIAAREMNELSLCLRFSGEGVTVTENNKNAYGAVLASTAKQVTEGGGSFFDKGYVGFNLGLESQQTIVKFFDQIPDTLKYERGLSSYYRARTAVKPETRSALLTAAAAAGISASYVLLSRLSFEQGRYIQGSAYADTFEQMHPRSAEGDELKIIRALSLLWYEEALSVCDILARKGFGSAAAVHSAEIFMKSGHGEKQCAALEVAYRADRNNADISSAILLSPASLPVIDSVASDHPWNSNAAVARAEKIFIFNGAKDALPYAASALLGSPSHPRALFLTGEIYHEMGELRLAKSYLSRAMEAAPDRKEFRERYEIFFGEPRRNQTDDAELWDRETVTYSNEPAVCVSNTTEISVYDDGSSSTRVREIYRVFSREKARNLDERTVAVDRNTDELVELRYRSLSDGVVTQSDEIHTQDLSDPDSRIYVDLTEYSIKAPDVKSGGYLIFEYLLRSNAGRSLHGYFGQEKYFDTTFQILHASITVNGSRQFRFKGYRCNPVIKESRNPDGNIITVLDVGALPKVREESGMVPFSDRVPSVAMTSFTDWREFHDWYSSQLINTWTVTAEMKSDVDRLCSGATDLQDIVARIYRSITSRIRYVGDEAGLGGYIPRTAAETYESRTGDCKDIALLLAAVLRMKGISADIALLRTADSGTVDSSFPALSSFNHAICRVNLSRPLYLDGTVKNRGILDLPVPDRDVDALVIGKDRAFVERIENSRYTVPEEASTTAVNISENLSAVCERQVVKRGPLTVSADNPSRDEDSSVSGFWTNLYPGAEIHGTVKDAGKESFSKISYTVVLPSFAQKAGNEIFIPVALAPFNIKDSFGHSVSRETDLYVGEFRESSSSVIYRLPEGYVITTLPKNEEIAIGGIRLKYDFSSNGKNEFTVNSRVSITRAVIPKEEYPAVKKFLSKCAVIEGASVCASAGGTK